MNELHEEIRQTMLALNQKNAQPVVEELQSHLANLFDMVRNELQQRLKERSWSEPSIGIAEQSEAPYKSVGIDCGDKQIAAEERDNSIREMLEFDQYVSGQGLSSRHVFCGNLYDAGYRKTGDAK